MQRQKRKAVVKVEENQNSVDQVEERPKRAKKTELKETGNGSLKEAASKKQLKLQEKEEKEEKVPKVVENGLIDDGKFRCGWLKRQLDLEYHDKEWGVPCRDDSKLFEFLMLDNFQAGLSWSTILQKRENLKKAFDNFDPVKISNYDSKKVEQLMNDSGIIRNRSKIVGSITNAQGFLQIQKEFGSFSKFLWDIVGNKTKVNTFTHKGDVPTQTPDSERMSAILKKRGFKFVGPTIIYAFMQAIGMVNDHHIECFRYKEVQKIH